MSYIAKHEIIYRDDLGQTGKISPDSVLTKAQEKAIAKDLPDLLKKRAVKEVKKPEESAVEPDGPVGKK